MLISYATFGQIVSIPDPNFKNALVNEAVVILNGTGGLQDADTNNDGEIQISEALSVTDMQVQDRNISSMEGLQSFENITKLLCFDNNLTEIDLSQNILLDELWVNQNNLSSLDVTMLPDLDFLSSSDNLLIELDVSQNPNLRIFRTSRNQILAIDLSNNLLLEQFWCSDNQVSVLDITNNSILTTFTGKGNPQLTTLNLQNGNNINMSRMWAQDNPLLDCILVDDETANYPSCDLTDNTGWCKDPEAIYANDPSSCSLGIRDIVEKSLEIFPNPASEILEVRSNIPVLSIEIKSISGQLVLVTDEKIMDISSLPTGLFIVSVKNHENQVTHKKLIKSNL